MFNSNMKLLWMLLYISYVVMKAEKKRMSSMETDDWRALEQPASNSIDQLGGLQGGLSSSFLTIHYDPQELTDWRYTLHTSYNHSILFIMLARRATQVAVSGHISHSPSCPPFLEADWTLHTRYRLQRMAAASSSKRSFTSSVIVKRGG